jgi:eukaryotic-like serine/threonine-protein kinase
MLKGELSPGDRCENYRIVRLIAAGGMGDVYEAMHDATGHAVALKCLKVRHRLKEDARTRMKMEAVVLSELQHANLVQVFDAGVTDSGMVWIAMERLHGETLRELLFFHGALPVERALFYACEIADGVDAVNAVNVVHRDLKPENVFVTDQDGVKVLDLGTGKFTGYGLNSTDRMRIVGTTAYMSPEQLKGLRVDARADVYALGLMVHEMITGRHALLSGADATELPEDVEQMAMLQLSLTPAPLEEAVPGIPAYISTVVARALAKNRDERYRTMSDFARELRAARKRYIAENQLEGRRDRLTPTVGLRHKLGQELPATAALGPEPARRSSPPAPAQGRRSSPPERPSSSRALSTDIQQRPPILDTGPTPVPAPLEYLPTEELAEGDDGTRARAKTTNTGPVRAPSQPTLDPMSYPGTGSAPRPQKRGVFASRPALRRIGATLGLGAIIGIPPAVIGVVWTMHRAPKAAVEAPASAPIVAVAPAAVAVVPAVIVAPAAVAVVPASVSVAVPAPSAQPVAAPKASAPSKRATTGVLVAPDWGAFARPSAKPKNGAPGGR